ncbi:MAG: hypothetical protein VR72_12530 [Clostridiaceae bacterium BRH_c20a]|nr:MAG: hypothetical protein VR72_12530 [Clostridiaceae bacterium BRH_c20a]
MKSENEESKVLENIEANEGKSKTNNQESIENKNLSTSMNSSLRVLDYLLILLILAIPVVNIIAILKWSFSKGININKRNFARATLILSIVAVMIITASSLFFKPDGPSGWAAEEVTAALANGFVPGGLTRNYGQGITREEAVNLLVRVYEKARQETVTPADPKLIKDTENEGVLKAAALGIVSVASGQTVEFRPNDPVPRQEMAVFMLRTALAVKPKQDFNKEMQVTFADAQKIQSWAQEGIYFAFNNKIFSSYEERIAPTMTLNREEGIICAQRLYEVVAR